MKATDSSSDTELLDETEVIDNEPSYTDVTPVLPRKRKPPTLRRPEERIKVMLAQTWSEQDPTGWWISEKLDGVRCYWNGKHLISRNDNRFYAPEFFTKELPTNVSLDGELWLGRKQFSQCLSIVKKQHQRESERWDNMTYRIFDIPSMDSPFEERMEYLKEYIPLWSQKYLKLVGQEKCRGTAHMNRKLKEVQGLGGEGLMLRQPNSFYENCRSHTLLKVKTFHDDEAVVVGYEEGKGRNEGVVGALVVQNQAGIKFKVGTGLSDADRARPPKVGSVIKYKYQELTNSGKPRFPVFLGRDVLV